ncbi:hypothetical protein [Streptomyces melanogenes]|uniref:hypothetical protein n=1 Tax=Streptomyces melanogenes TaxID=67326 RepID=UPI00167D0F21|nr:hypothetical protein [Streptomyces melanogenes]
MALSAASRYDRCPCAGHYERRTVEVQMTVEGKPVVVEGVEQGRCPMCRSRVYRAVVLEALEGVMRARRLPEAHA